MNTATWTLGLIGVGIVAAFAVDLATRAARWWRDRPRKTSRLGVPHNLIAHPLWVLVPPLGFWLHERTRPAVPTIARRLELRRRRRHHRSALNVHGRRSSP